MNIGILGGGIGGLTLQRFLRHPSEVLEKERRPAGCAGRSGRTASASTSAATSSSRSTSTSTSWSTGCSATTSITAGGPTRSSSRAGMSNIRSRTTWRALEKQDCYECLIDYLKNDFPEPTNLEEWGYHTFGRAIAEKYFLPYNRKIWKTEPREMSLDWVGRVPRPPIEDVVKSALGIETEGYTHQLYFRYPLRGGFEALVRAIVMDPSRVHCGSPIRSIREQRERLDGRSRVGRPGSSTTS